MRVDQQVLVVFLIRSSAPSRFTYLDWLLCTCVNGFNALTQRKVNHPALISTALINTSPFVSFHAAELPAGYSISF